MVGCSFFDACLKVPPKSSIQTRNRSHPGWLFILNISTCLPIPYCCIFFLTCPHYYNKSLLHHLLFLHHSFYTEETFRLIHSCSFLCLCSNSASVSSFAAWSLSFVARDGKTMPLRQRMVVGCNSPATSHTRGAAATASQSVDQLELERADYTISTSSPVNQ